MARPSRTAVVGFGLLAVVLLVLAVAAVRAVRDDGGGDDFWRSDVVVIGDSVTDQSQVPIKEAFPGQDVAVIGLPGLRTDQILPVVHDVLGGDSRPPVAVVMTGYNDLWQEVESIEPIEEALDVMAGVDCAIWMLVPTTGPWDRGRAEELDRQVQAAARAAGVHVETGWRDAVDAGGTGPDHALISPDDVHPEEAGARKVGEVVGAAVDRFCG